MKRWYGVVCFLLWAGMGICAENASLDALVSDPKIWSLKQDEFARHVNGMSFAWTSEAKESARSTDRSLTFANHPIWEAVVWFGDAGVREVVISLYNRGDSGPMAETNFLKLAESMSAALTQRTGARANIKEFKHANEGLPRKSATWNGKDALYQLDWAWSVLKEHKGIQPEYVRLRVISADEAGGVSAGQKVSSFALADKKVERLPNGDVLLADIPMVDQGEKGYCATATMERILRYYGTTVDQHQIAQIAGTQQGTDPESMVNALQKAALSLRIKVTVLEEFDVKKFLRLVESYNQMAKKLKKSGVDLGSSRVINVAQIYAQMEADVLRKTRTQNAAQVNGFLDKVKQNIEKRIPLAWGVTLGFVKEEGLPQVNGGHMRMIIGYNQKTREILYSDSWGAGHENKRMSVDDAWTITTCVLTIAPR